MKKVISSIVLAVILIGCTNEPTLTPHQVKKLSLTKDQVELCQRQNDFSINMLKAVCEQENGNVFISPLSAAFVCAMTANGAKGKTRDEILKVIGAEGFDMSTLNAHILNLMENLPYQDPTTYVGIANAAWVDKDYPIESDFMDDIRTHFLATVDNIELSDPASAQIINTWAKKATKGMVPKICDDNYFTEDLRLVLANALCFKGDWEEQFKSSNTRNQIFHAAQGDIEVKMMHAELNKSFCTCSQFYNRDGQQIDVTARILRMYYKDKGYCMDVILPNEGLSLDEWMPTLTTDWMNEVLEHIDGNVTVSFPKFTMKGHYNLNTPLQAMGMKTVFTIDADLTGINREGLLYLNLLQQDTYLEIDEEGTKAAAVTSGWFTNKYSPVQIPFIVDRPFVFFIRDVQHGIILFAGRINNPNQ